MLAKRSEYRLESNHHSKLQTIQFDQIYSFQVILPNLLAQRKDCAYTYIVSIQLNDGACLPMSQDHRPLTQTRQLMIDIVAQSERPLTRTEIVNRLDRKKTPHLISMMDELVDTGVFQRSIFTFNNGVTGYVYSLAQEFAQE